MPRKPTLKLAHRKGGNVRVFTRVSGQTVLDANKVARYKPRTLDQFDMREPIDSDRSTIGGDLTPGLFAFVVHPVSDSNEVAGYLLYDLQHNLHWLWTRECYRLRGIARWLLGAAFGPQPFYYEYDKATADGENFLIAVSNEHEPSNQNN